MALENNPVQLDQRSLIDYFRRCYRADSQDLAIANIDKLQLERRIPLLQEDVLACGEFDRLPVIHEMAEKLFAQADLYRKERRLIYGFFMVSGTLDTATGFTQQRKIHSPLLYYPAQLYRDGDIYAAIDSADVQLNTTLLRLLLKPEIHNSAIETFPLPKFPIGTAAVAQMSFWLNSNTQLTRLEQMAHWPQLQLDLSPSKHLRIESAAYLLLVDRAQGSRGVMHELKQMHTDTNLSGPTKVLLGSSVTPNLPATSTPERLPNILSKAQIKALHNAATQTLSLVAGPPGTGKSYTIAAMAIDRMLQGESVLIVAKTDQAISVIGEKLQTDFALQTGVVQSCERSYLQTIKKYLEDLLQFGLPKSAPLADSLQALQTTIKNLTSSENAFYRQLWCARHHTAGDSIWKAWRAKIFHKFYPMNAIYKQQCNLLQQQQQLVQHSIRYINRYRAAQLTRLLQTERTTLVKFLNALRARNSKTQTERFADLQFATILQAFPIWLINIDELHSVLPFKRNQFDLVIVDEASQCDIASALPALQRAKRAVILGDSKQLRHMSFLARNKQQELWQSCGLPGSVVESMSFRDSSLMDLSADSMGCQDCVCLLDEHYRSKPELIAFSNQTFYQNRLKIMRNKPQLNPVAALQFIAVGGKRSAAGANTKEKDAILAELEHLFNASDSAGVKSTIGVLSPYREQTQYLQKHIDKTFTLERLSQHRVLVATPFGFQGEERDIMLISMAIDSQSIRAAAYLNRPDMFNVAITRAKHLQKLYVSITAEELPPTNLLRAYLDQQIRLTTPIANTDNQRCNFASQVTEPLLQAGVQVWQDYCLAGQQIDLLCEYNGILLAIDLIGYRGDFAGFAEIQTYKILSRANVELLPLAYGLWRSDPRLALQKIFEKLQCATRCTINKT